MRSIYMYVYIYIYMYTYIYINIYMFREQVFVDANLVKLYGELLEAFTTKS